MTKRASNNATAAEELQVLLTLDAPLTVGAANSGETVDELHTVVFSEQYRGGPLTVADGRGEVWSGDVPEDGATLVAPKVARRLHAHVA